MFDFPEFVDVEFKIKITNEIWNSNEIGVRGFVLLIGWPQSGGGFCRTTGRDFSRAKFEVWKPGAKKSAWP